MHYVGHYSPRTKSIEVPAYLQLHVKAQIYTQIKSSEKKEKKKVLLGFRV
jgi:hypothetical protein